MESSKRTRSPSRSSVPNNAASTQATRNLTILAARAVAAAAAPTKRTPWQARTTMRTTAVNFTRPSSGKGKTSAGNLTIGAAPDTGAAHLQDLTTTTTVTPSTTPGRPKVDKAAAVAEEPKEDEEAEGKEGTSVEDPPLQPL